MTASPGIGTLQEGSLHAALKNWYSEPGDAVEAKMDGYFIDVRKADGELVEIQTGSFASARTKLRKLVGAHRVRLVYPVATAKWLVKIGPGGELLGRRRSPKRGRTESVFAELVSFPDLLCDQNFTLEVLLIHEEEVRRYDGSGSWRHPDWRKEDQQLVEVIEPVGLPTLTSMQALLPSEQALPRPFTNKGLAAALRLPPRLAGQMTYCLRKMGALDLAGRGPRNAHLYAEPPTETL